MKNMDILNIFDFVKIKMNESETSLKERDDEQPELSNEISKDILHFLEWIAKLNYKLKTDDLFFESINSVTLPASENNISISELFYNSIEEFINLRSLNSLKAAKEKSVDLETSLDDLLTIKK